MNLKFSLSISLSLSFLILIQKRFKVLVKKEIWKIHLHFQWEFWYFSGKQMEFIKSNSTHWRNRLSQVSSSFSIRNNKFEKYPGQSQQVLNYLHFQFP